MGRCSKGSEKWLFAVVAVAVVVVAAFVVAVAVIGEVVAVAAVDDVTVAVVDAVPTTLHPPYLSL